MNNPPVRDIPEDPWQQIIEPEFLNLLLVRHGEAGGNGTLGGYGGSALSKRGEGQAKLLAQRLAKTPIVHIYCSDMARSFQTARAVHERHPSVPFTCCTEVREISSFQVAGFSPARTREERTALHEERERVKRFITQLKTNHRPGEMVAIIAHNGVNALIQATLAGHTLRQGMRFICCHTGVTMVNLPAEPHRVSLRMMGCSRHLPPEWVTFANVTGEGKPIRTLFPR